jgi:hypothetical protein
MATVEKFTRSMIEHFLQESDMRYFTDSDGDFLVQFSYDEELGCSLNMYFMASGDDAEIYYISARSDRRILKNDWEQALKACNAWNRERRWPKAYLRVDKATDASGEIVLESQIDLEQGVHQELLNSFSQTMIAGVGMFWKWAHQEQGL